MIEVRDLTKRFGDKVAVDHLSFTVQPERVTGFLGPNGAGKSTTMRLILALDHPNSGSATINGKPYADLPNPLRTVGALLEAKSVHPGRSARNHLLFLAQTQGIPADRVEEVLALVGLQEAADKRAGGFSLGMSGLTGEGHRPGLRSSASRPFPRPGTGRSPGPSGAGSGKTLG